MNKRACRVITLMIVAAVVAGFAQTPQQKDMQPAARDVAPPPCDFAQLKLQVSSATVVETINHAEGTVKAKEGYKLVVVRLEGEGGIPKDFELASNWAAKRCISKRDWLLFSRVRINNACSRMKAYNVGELRRAAGWVGGQHAEGFPGRHDTYLAKAVEPEARSEAVPGRSERGPCGGWSKEERCADDLCC